MHVDCSMDGWFRYIKLHSIIFQTSFMTPRQINKFTEAQNQILA